MDASERGVLLYKLADLMERDRNYLAVIKTINYILFINLIIVTI